MPAAYLVFREAGARVPAGVEDEMEDQKDATDGQRSTRRRRILYALMGSAALVAAVAVVVGAQPLVAAIQDGAGFHRPGRGGWGHHRMTPEAAKEHAQIAAKWALRGIDANEVQQEKVNKVLGGAIDDLFRLKEQHQANREAFAAQLGGASIDRAALEEIRKSEMALADEASRRFVEAMADVAEVLTPEQRQQLLDHVHRHGH
jgi:Spy/CpxP family protein refolding chaperone